jgi:O-antigen ligase
MRALVDKKHNLISAVPAYLLCILIVSFPMIIELLKIKGIIFVFLIFIVSLKLMKNRMIYLHDKILLMTWFQISVSLLFLAIGYINGAPGVAKQAQVYVIWPLVYLLLISELSGMDSFKKVQNVLLLATLIIIASGFNYILSELGIMLPIINFNYASTGARYGIQAGYMKLEFIGLNSFAFLIPYLTTLVINHDPKNNSKIYRYILLVTLFLGLALVIMSGRRAVLLVTLLAPVITLFLNAYQDRTSIINSFIQSIKVVGWIVVAMMVLLVVIGNIIDISLTGIYDFFASGFDFSSSADLVEYVRKEQFYALLNGWLSSPLLGSGLGSYTTASIRSIDMPWSYELYYLSLLFQTGVVGFVSYFIGIGWLYWIGLKIIRRNDYFSSLIMPYLVGMSCFLIASASNPYLSSFEGIWVIFLTVAVINYYLIENNA